MGGGGRGGRGGRERELGGGVEREREGGDRERHIDRDSRRTKDIIGSKQQNKKRWRR